MAKKKDTTGEVKIADAFAAKTLGYNSVEEMNADKKRREKSQTTVGGEWDEETATQELKQKEAEYQKSIGLSKALRDNSEKGWKDRAYNSFTSGQDRAITNALHSNQSFDDAYKAYLDDVDEYNYDLKDIYRGNVEQLKNMFRARYDELAGLQVPKATESKEVVEDARVPKRLERAQKRDVRKAQRQEMRDARIASKAMAKEAEAKNLRKNERELNRSFRKDLRASERELAREMRGLRVPIEKQPAPAPTVSPTPTNNEAWASREYYESGQFDRDLNAIMSTAPKASQPATTQPATQTAPPANKAVKENTAPTEMPTLSPTFEEDVDRALNILTPKTEYKGEGPYKPTFDLNVAVEDENIPDDEFEYLNPVAPKGLGVSKTVREEDVKSAKLPIEDKVESAADGLQLPTREDPYKRTKEAIANANKSWRQMLLDNYEKRQAENKKRVRSAQIVGLGKALGDLVAGIWGGAASLKNNAPAIVPAMQSSKTSEEIEKLINEGVVNAKDYDTMLLNLAMQEEKDKIALAKAYDELGIKQKQDALDHQQRLEVIKAQGQKQQAIETLKGTIRAAIAAQNAKDKKSLETLKGEIRKQIKAIGGVNSMELGDLSYPFYRLMYPGEVEYSTTTETSKDTPLGTETTTRTVSGTKRVPDTKQTIALAKKEQDRLVKAFGLSGEEIEYIAGLYEVMQKNKWSEADLRAKLDHAKKRKLPIAEFIKHYGK